jgi:hypothetical protein
VASGSGEQVNEIVNATLRLCPLGVSDFGRVARIKVWFVLKNVPFA